MGLYGAQDAAPTPLLQSALIPRWLRHPLVLRNQPQTAQQSLRSSRKYGRSPSPTTESAKSKRRGLSGMASGTVDTTLPLGSSTFLSPTGSLSEVVEPLAPSITSTPLGKVGYREGCTVSSDSRLLSTSLFASSSFNIPGLPSVGFGSLTPSVPSIAGSHHISSTWPPTRFPPANQLRLTQMLSGLEAIHRNSVQGMAHEMLTLGHSAREATYTPILRDNITEAECKAMMCRLCSEADAAWKQMHEVMYNHQLEYDRRLSDFLKEAEAMLANMRD